MIDPGTARYGSTDLLHFTTAVLAQLGLEPGDAALGAAVLHDADLAGVDTHGIANLATHAHYAHGLISGAVAPRPTIVVRRESPVTAAWDSGRGFGPVVAHRAMEAAIAKAGAAGVGMVTVRDGRHFGAVGYFAELAARRGLIGMAAANTPPASFPPGGSTMIVGTSPFGFTAPIADEPPLVVDIAMTAVSGSRVTFARRSGEVVPEGWVVDADGNPSTDPRANREGGALELLGGPVARHKGYGLALMVDALGILAGNGSGAWQPATPGTVWSQGQWFAAWRTDLFVEPAEFLADMRRLADELHAMPALPGCTVRVPGARRASCRIERERDGVPLRANVVADLVELADDVGVPFPQPLASTP